MKLHPPSCPLRTTPLRFRATESATVRTKARATALTVHASFCCTAHQHSIASARCHIGAGAIDDGQKRHRDQVASPKLAKSRRYSLNPMGQPLPGSRVTCTAGRCLVSCPDVMHSSARALSVVSARQDTPTSRWSLHLRACLGTSLATSACPRALEPTANIHAHDDHGSSSRHSPLHRMPALARRPSRRAAVPVFERSFSSTHELLLIHHEFWMLFRNPFGQKDRFRASQQTGGSVSSTLWETPLSMPCRSTPGCRPGRRRTAAAAAERADVLSPRIDVGFMQNLVAIRWRVWWWSLNMCFAAGQLAIF